MKRYFKNQLTPLVILMWSRNDRLHGSLGPVRTLDRHSGTMEVEENEVGGLQQHK
ncbi:hypothetical protein GDO81_016585 [Engystomops pustulosus]|uniref:Uncharacterized protein n=1 Tax=Engystomops pustulosus TaxID=76066 RepID=A0AAV7B0X2_ENGPU|nr:hypothetical protein GDO81_016585 [Engystomops pustulosus]